MIKCTEIPKASDEPGKIRAQYSKIQYFQKRPALQQKADELQQTVPLSYHSGNDYTAALK